MGQKSVFIDFFYFRCGILIVIGNGTYVPLLYPEIVANVSDWFILGRC